MDSIRGLAEGVAGDFQRFLPRQRKTQRTNLSLLVATMLDVRSANLMDLAAGLPRDAWIIAMSATPGYLKTDLAPLDRTRSNVCHAAALISISAWAWAGVL